MTIHVTTLHIPRRKRKSRTIMGLFGVHLEFQPKMIYRHSTGFLCYTSVLKKQLYNAGSAKCSMKPPSKLLTSILSAVKTGLQSYCDTSYSRGGVNQIWFLKNSKYSLEYSHSRSLSSYNSIKTLFDFSTPCTTIRHSMLKEKKYIISLTVFHKKKWPT